MRGQNGSAIIWIFIGILLFAALSVAMMSGSRTSGNMITGEQARTTATRVIGFGNEMKMTVKRMQARGCLDTQIGFDNTVWTNYGGTPLMGPGENPNTPNDTCRIFNVAGGNLTPAVFPDHGVVQAPTTFRSGHSVAGALSVVGVGTSAPDLVLFTVFLDKQVCITINEKLGISNPAGVPPEDNYYTMGWYHGVYNGTGIIGDDAPQFVGRGAGCYHYLGGDGFMIPYDYYFYQVLIAR